MDRNRKWRLQILAGLQVLAAAAVAAAVIYLLYRYVQYGEQAARETGAGLTAKLAETEGTGLFAGSGETAGTELTGAELAGTEAAEEERAGQAGGAHEQDASTDLSDGNGKLPGTIRVRLLDSALAGTLHSEIRVSCEKAFTVKLDGKRVKKGKSYAIGAAELEAGQVIELCPKDALPLTVESLDRADGHPRYTGTLWLYREAEGIALVNELPLEEYLCGVVSSEMPSDYPMEAQKAQAVCARTYACNCIRNVRGEVFGEDPRTDASKDRQETSGNRAEAPKDWQDASGDARGWTTADLDDSVSYQVYNNYQATESSRKAVEATEGEILPLAEIQYYSTSCQSEHREDLDSDEAFREFLEQEPDAGAEYGSPWLRWETELSADDILECLAARYGWQTERIDEILVTERKGNGQVTELEIRSGDLVKTVSGEYAIRQLLSPAQTSLRLRDGEEHAGMASLPSAFFWLEVVRAQEPDEEREAAGAQETGGAQELDRVQELAGVQEPDGGTSAKTDGKAVSPIARVAIHGGGYGHGIGMSQYGAAALAKKGLDYREILEYYYDVGVVSR